jgi:hypothetical protein
MAGPQVSDNHRRKSIDLHHTRSQEQRAISAPSSSRYDGFRMARHQNINFEAEDHQAILPRARRERLPGIHLADRGADGWMRHDEPGENRNGRRRLPRLGGGAGRTLGAAQRPAGHGITRALLTSLPRADPSSGADQGAQRRQIAGRALGRQRGLAQPQAMPNANARANSDTAPAVDFQHHAGQERGLVAGEKKRGGPDVLGRRKAA